ncbi:retroviral-like aspartic protease family protein [Pseudoroseomonas cervicalis]|uniref:retroviral-like aspartic protease family protein n=1 Tax=Teichococcus cervicalis TaxID=204525 RepID=UPI002784996A|nr:aspartyl protease family protein [Pseudoroseomonas cervicalis]MDQ1077917.1 hypothetical protein [Pseudoroseomonas cervicalis]
MTLTRAPALLLLLGLAHCAAGPGAGPATGGTQPECRYDTTQGLALQGPTGLLLPAEINGQALLMEVNTGLGLSSLLPAVAGRLELPPDPTRQSSYGGRGAPITARNVLARSLRIGPQAWSDVSLGVRPVAGDRAPDGFLAADLLQQTELELELGARRVALHPRRNCRAGEPPWAPAASLPLMLREHGTPVITVRINGEPVQAVIQSGNNATILNRRLAERLRLPAAAATGRRSRSQDLRGMDGRGTEYRVALAAGAETLPDQLVVVSDESGGQDLVLGQDWLARRKVWISYGGRRVFLAPPGG